MIWVKEPNQYKWIIKYQYIENDKLVTVIEDSIRDFIPNIGEIVVVEDKIYCVNNKLYDYDNSTILISLSYAKELVDIYNQENKVDD